MRAHRLPDRLLQPRTVEIVCQSLALRSLFDVGGQGLIALVRSRLKSAR
jgi:hypothetical protein